MSKVSDFLNEAGVFFMATADGNQPKLRPLGAHMEADGKIIFGADGNYADQMIKAAGLEKIYNEQTGNKLMTFHLENASAVDIPVMGEGENLM